MDQCTHWSVYPWGVYFIPLRSRPNDFITATFREKCRRNYIVGYVKSVHRIVHRASHHSNVAEQFDDYIIGCCSCCIGIDHSAKCCSYYHGGKHWHDYHKYYCFPWLY